MEDFQNRILSQTTTVGSLPPWAPLLYQVTLCVCSLHFVTSVYCSSNTRTTGGGNIVISNWLHICWLTCILPLLWHILASNNSQLHGDCWYKAARVSLRRQLLLAETTDVQLIGIYISCIDLVHRRHLISQTSVFSTAFLHECVYICIHFPSSRVLPANCNW